MVGSLSAAASGSESAVSPSPPSCSMRASISPTRFWSGALNRPTIAVSGAAIAPSTWPRSTSSGGSVARLSMSSADDRAALQDAAADREHLRLAGGVGERLRDRDGVAVGLEERDRGRAFEQREQRVGAGGLGRAAGQRVLHDRNCAPCLSSSVRSVVDLRHRQPAVVGDDQRVASSRSRSVRSATTRSLSSFCIVIPSEMTEPARRRADERRCARPSATSAGLLPSRLPAVFGRSVGYVAL